jgi:hypothetical protein
MSSPFAPPFTKTQRTRILKEYKYAMKAYNAAMDAEQYERGKALGAIIKSRSSEYFACVPRIPISCCPYDGLPLIRSFDAFGFDGLWWGSSATPEELPACPHFAVLLGAVSLEGREPEASTFEVRPGPEVPYVVPRLLELPGMIAVISEIAMDPGYRAFPIAYFTNVPPAAEDLVPSWARSTYSYQTAEGESGWKGVDDPWDFDLLPWLHDGKIRWSLADDPATLNTNPSERCPYVDLPGTREIVALQENKRWTEGVPTGEISSPLD